MSVLVECANCGHEALVDQSPLLAGKAQARIEAALPTLVCKRCGSRNAKLVQATKKEGCCERCETCGCAIPPARLEALPNANLCVTCQEQAEGEPEGLGRCPRCGCDLVMRLRKRGGIGSYFVGCVAFPGCRYIQRD